MTRGTNDRQPMTNQVIPEAAVAAAASAIYGARAREWGIMEKMACESQARRALKAAAPYMQATAEDAPRVTPRPCLERHSHPDPAYMCMAPEGHK